VCIGWKGVGEGRWLGGEGVEEVGLPRIDNTETGAKGNPLTVNLARAANPDKCPGEKKGYKLGSALFAFSQSHLLKDGSGVEGLPFGSGGGGGCGWRVVPLQSCRGRPSGPARPSGSERMGVLCSDMLRPLRVHAVVSYGGQRCGVVRPSAGSFPVVLRQLSGAGHRRRRMGGGTVGTRRAGRAGGRWSL